MTDMTVEECFKLSKGNKCTSIQGISVTNLGLGSRRVCYSPELKVLIESSLDAFPNTDRVSHSLLIGDTSLCPLGWQCSTSCQNQDSWGRFTRMEKHPSKCQSSLIQFKMTFKKPVSGSCFYIRHVHIIRKGTDSKHDGKQSAWHNLDLLTWSGGKISGISTVREYLWPWHSSSSTK